MTLIYPVYLEVAEKLLSRWSRESPSALDEEEAHSPNSTSPRPADPDTVAELCRQVDELTSQNQELVLKVQVRTHTHTHTYTPPSTAQTTASLPVLLRKPRLTDILNVTSLKPALHFFQRQDFALNTNVSSVCVLTERAVWSVCVPAGVDGDTDCPGGSVQVGCL